MELDLPVPIMFWDPMEFIIATSFMGFGMIIDNWLFGGMMCAIVLIGAQKMKKGAKRGAVQHLIWKMGLPIDPVLGNYFPKPWVNDFIE